MSRDQRELTRLEVIQRVERKTLKQHQAAELLSFSVRQIKRLCKAYQRAGAAGLISKRRGRPGNNRLPEKTINKARQLLRSRYHDFGLTLAAEKLAQRTAFTWPVLTAGSQRLLAGIYRGLQCALCGGATNN